MSRGYVAPELRCGAKNKQREQCGNAGVVFTDPPRCRFHFGHTPAALRKAEERARQYEMGMLDPLDPPAVRRAKLRAWGEVEVRLARRRMRKAGILEDFDRAAGRVGRPVSKPDEHSEAVRQWLRDGRQGPRPLLAGEPELAEPKRPQPELAEPEPEMERPRQPKRPPEPAPEPEPPEPELGRPELEEGAISHEIDWADLLGLGGWASEPF